MEISVIITLLGLNLLGIAFVASNQIAYWRELAEFLDRREEALIKRARNNNDHKWTQQAH